jgi:phosphoenolpyruvate carboxykinase (ATP)
MEQLGLYNPANGVAAIGLDKVSRVNYNLSEVELYEEAIRRGEADLTADGALRAVTGQHTGRSPKDKFVVRDAVTEDKIWWDNNKPMSPEHFAVLKADMLAHAAGRELFVQDLIGGADADNALPTRVVTEYAWHALFIRNLLIRPKRDTLGSFEQKLTIINLPSFRADPERHGCRSETVIACDLANGLVLIGGTSYAGENKKSVISV